MAKRPIYYDTETTGLKAAKDRIIEIAAFDPVQNRTFCKLVNPMQPLSQITIDLCNITDDMVKDAPTFDVVGKEFIEFCSSDVVLIAHNNDSFDKLFLEAEFARADLEMPTWPFIDSLKWARKYRPDLPKHSLQYLRQMYNVKENNAHRALDDVVVLHEIFEKMVDDLSMETIMELLNKPKNKNVEYMPFGKYQGKKLTEVPSSYVTWLAKSSAFEKEENKALKEGFEKLGLLTGG
ncbi:MAG: DNA polymerase III PolC-type [Candidatus Anoxychlamydiales bacterium]|nr:DNA polymerase III PolC-type [Candidatus Anoxychlamydiales bacterium]